MTTLPADANGPPLLVVLEAAEDAAGELVRGWLEDGVPAAASSGATSSACMATSRASAPRPTRTSAGTRIEATV